MKTKHDAILIVAKALFARDFSHLKWDVARRVREEQLSAATTAIEALMDAGMLSLSPDNGVQNAAAIRALAHKRWDNDECTVTSDAVLDQAEEDGAVWVTCQRLLTADVLKDNGLLIDPYEVAARAAGWERGGDFGGFWYDDSEYGHWKAAASDNDAFTFATAEEVCEHLGLEVEETGWQPAPVTTPDPGKPAEGAAA